MVIDILNAPVGSVIAVFPQFLFEDGGDKVVQATGTAEEKDRITGRLVGIADLVLIGGI